MSEQTDAPDCPHCQCNDTTGLKPVSRWGQVTIRRRCNHCGFTWTPPPAPRETMPRRERLRMEQAEEQQDHDERRGNQHESRRRR